MFISAVKLNGFTFGQDKMEQIGSAVVERSASDWKVAGSVPALTAHELKKLNSTLLLVVPYVAVEPPPV